jgi:RimJ/RimL family protein N-acetyltransferase
VPKPKIQSFLTDRGRLRLIEASDLEHTLRWRNHDDSRRWFRYDQMLTIEQHNNWFSSYLGKDDDFTFIFEVDDRPVGQFAVYNLDSTTRQAEVGRILLDQQSRGKGFASEALYGVMALAKEQLFCRKLWLEVKKGNDKAIRVYQACSFQPVWEDADYVRMERNFDEPFSRRVA